MRWTPGQRRHLRLEICRALLPFVAAACVLLPRTAVAQGLTGALIGTVKDDQGGVLPGADVHVGSPALIGGPATLITNEKGQLRFLALPPGLYVLDIELQGFATYHEEDVHVGAGATIERTAVLKLAGLAESVVVEGAGSRVEARHPGFGTRFGPEDLTAIPTRRSGMFDFIRTAPGISATSQGSGTTQTEPSELRPPRRTPRRRVVAFRSWDVRRLSARRERRDLRDAAQRLDAYASSAAS